MTLRPKLDRIWASEGEKSSPDSLYSTGWLRAEKPEHAHENYLINNDFEFYKECVQDGIPFWRDNVVYDKGAIVNLGGIIWVAKIANSNKNPSTFIDSIWEHAFGSLEYSGVTETLRDITNITNAHIKDYNNPHEVTPSKINVDTESEFDTKISNLHDKIDIHVLNKSTNPHKVTYSQLGILPVAGGDFTGQVDFEAKSLGINSGTINVDDTQINLKLGNNRLQLKDDVFFNDERVLTIGNYNVINNKFNSQFSVPTPDVIIPCNADLTAWYGCVDGVTISWDNPQYDKIHGLRIQGTVEFDGSDFLGQELSIGIYLNHNVEAVFGDLTIHHDNSDTIVQDGGVNIVGSNTGTGYYIYTRSTSKGTLYKEGVKVAEHNITASTTHTTCSITGTGNIKHLQFWGSALTKEQVSMVR